MEFLLILALLTGLSWVCYRYWPLRHREPEPKPSPVAWAAQTDRLGAIPAPVTRRYLPPVFSVRDLTKRYLTGGEETLALRRVNLTIEDGLTAIVGESGEGKSTLLNILGGLMAPTEGEVTFRGRFVNFDDEDALRRYRTWSIAWVFQDLNLISHLSAVENAALPLICRGMSRTKALSIAWENLDRVGMASLMGRYPHQLSRGQKQRVAIARAFTSDAEVILADEPTGSLDIRTAEGVMRAFYELAQHRGKPVVLVTHNPELAHQYCDRIVRCHQGTIREEWKHGQVRRALLMADLVPQAQRIHEADGNGQY